MALFQRTGVTPNVRFTTLESFSVMSMVEQGLGMSVMNKLITEKRVCDIAMLPVDPPASITLGIALHSRADLSPAVRRFLKYAVRMLTKQEKNKSKSKAPGHVPGALFFISDSRNYQRKKEAVSICW